MIAGLKNEGLDREIGHTLITVAFLQDSLSITTLNNTSQQVDKYVSKGIIQVFFFFFFKAIFPQIGGEKIGTLGGSFF